MAQGYLPSNQGIKMSVKHCDEKLEAWKVRHQPFYDATCGSKEAIQQVMEDFMPMVHMWAHRYEDMCPNFLYDDLVQEGALGVIHAIKTFSFDKRTSNGSPISPSTWVWWKVRSAVQTAARKYKTLFKSSTAEGVKALEEVYFYEEKEPHTPLNVESILIEGCGSLNSKRAQIIKDRFGLMGATPMKQGEVAKKHGISKQAANSHIVRFCKAIREKYPELEGAIQ